MELDKEIGDAWFIVLQYMPDWWFRDMAEDRVIMHARKYCGDRRCHQCGARDILAFEKSPIDKFMNAAKICRAVHRFPLKSILGKFHEWKEYHPEESEWAIRIMEYIILIAQNHWRERGSGSAPSIFEIREYESKLIYTVDWVKELDRYEATGQIMKFDWQKKERHYGSRKVSHQSRCLYWRAWMGFAV
jgi:hypothetical protein